MVDVQCVGAGGGSIARVRQGSLLVGPESAGSPPGPGLLRARRHGRHGHRRRRGARLPARRRFAGGACAWTGPRPGGRERDVAGPLGVDVVEAAWGIERIVNANMANAARRVLAGSGVDPRDLALIAYGGNGPVHAWAIAAELGVDRILVPKAAPAFSALGLLVSDYKVDLPTPTSPPCPASTSITCAAGGRAGRRGHRRAGPDRPRPRRRDRTRYVQMAYGGQNFDMSVPAPTGEPGDAAD